VQHNDLDWAFAHIPLLAGRTAEDFHIAALPGYTNRNYRLHNPAEDWVLRMPRPLTNRLIDRSAEAHNQTLAHRLGLAPRAIVQYGERIGQGKRCAFLRLARSAEVHLPITSTVLVSPGDEVIAGTDIVGKLLSH